MYVFFAVSLHRWNLLLTGLKSEEKNKIIVLKTLSSTRCEYHAESCKAIILNYDQIICTLTDIFENSNEKQENRHETKSMKNKMIKFKTTFMAVLWSENLSQ
jgi:predicted house-cleaning NTP pyrophosphatase (Maf/HAM1 superfamily)